MQILAAISDQFQQSTKVQEQLKSDAQIDRFNTAKVFETMKVESDARYKELTVKNDEMKVQMEQLLLAVSANRDSGPGVGGTKTTEQSTETEKG